MPWNERLIRYIPFFVPSFLSPYSRFQSKGRLSASFAAEHSSAEEDRRHTRHVCEKTIPQNYV